MEHQNVPIWDISDALLINGLKMQVTPPEYHNALPYPSNAEIPAVEKCLNSILMKLFANKCFFFKLIFSFNIYDDYKFLRSDVLIRVHTKRGGNDFMLENNYKNISINKIETVYYDRNKKIHIINYLSHLHIEMKLVE